MRGSNSNLRLIAVLNNMADNINKIQNEAGNMLVQNIRLEANDRFKKGDGKYPYEYHDSFAQDDVVFYSPNEQKVYVDHPAAKRLEYGLKTSLTIQAQNKQLKFKGQEGNFVYTDEVTVAPTKPVGYARAAIKKTAKELKSKFKDIIYAG